jgi:hypothetical protein
MLLFYNLFQKTEKRTPTHSMKAHHNAKTKGIIRKKNYRLIYFMNVDAILQQNINKILINQSHSIF